MTIDPDLIGIWNNGGSRPVEITQDAELWILGKPWPYSIASDDMTVTFPGTNPLWVLTRISGAGSLVGLWERFETDSSGTWREEWLIRADGSYTYHWSLDGQFDSEGIGTYTDSGTHMTTRERRSAITTGAGNTITIAQFFGPLQQGTYTVASDKKSWVLHLPTGDVTFTK